MLKVAEQCARPIATPGRADGTPDSRKGVEYIGVFLRSQHEHDSHSRGQPMEAAAEDAAWEEMLVGEVRCRDGANVRVMLVLD